MISRRQPYLTGAAPCAPHQPIRDYYNCYSVSEVGRVILTQSEVAPLIFPDISNGSCRRFHYTGRVLVLNRSDSESIRDFHLYCRPRRGSRPQS